MIPISVKKVEIEDNQVEVQIEEKEEPQIDFGKMETEQSSISEFHETEKMNVSGKSSIYIDQDFEHKYAKKRFSFM